MTFEDLIQQFREYPNFVRANVVQACGIYGADSIAKVADRIQKTGKDAQGSPLQRRDGSDYSTAYRRAKQEAGRYQGFVDLSFSRRMWSNLQYRGCQEEGDQIRAIITTDNSEDQQKVVDNTLRYGDFLEMSEQETQEVAENIAFDIQSQFDQYFSNL